MGMERMGTSSRDIQEAIRAGFNYLKRDEGEEINTDTKVPSLDDFVQDEAK